MPQHLAHQQPDKAQQSQTDRRPSRAAMSVTKSVSLPAMLSLPSNDNIPGAALVAISRSRTTTTLTSAEEALATIAFLGRSQSAAPDWAGLSRRLFARDQDHGIKLYAANAALREAEVEEMEEDTLLGGFCSKSTESPIAAQACLAPNPGLSSSSSSPSLSSSSSSSSPASSTSCQASTAALASTSALASPSTPAPTPSPVGPLSPASAVALHRHPCPHSRPASCPSLCPHPQVLQQSPPPPSKAATSTWRRQSLGARPSPIVIHRSKSITVLATGSSSSALNISPVECHSLSLSTASPADAAYFAATSPRFSTFGPSSFKRRSSTFFASLSPSSSLSSLSSILQGIPSPPPPPPSSNAAQPYQAPAYLTAFFAETASRPPSAQSAPASSSPLVAPNAHALSKARSLSFARQDRSCPLTIAPDHAQATASLPPAQKQLPSYSCSNSLLRSTFSSRHHHHHHHSRHISLDPKSHAASSTGTRYRSHHNTAPSTYQPIMIPRKAKQAVLSLVTTEQSKDGPSRSTQSTVSGGNWGEPSLAAASSHDPQQTLPLEPNSASSGQDPWLVVTGSGSSYATNNPNIAGPVSSELQSCILTPMSTREEQLSKLPPLRLVDRYEDTDPVLDLDVAHQIRLELPRKLRNATKWNLVYSSDQHGISMTTLFHRCKSKGPMVLAIKDTRNGVFGAYVNEELKPNLSYYGTGECFLWNVTTLISSPEPPASPSFAPSPMQSPSPLQLSSNVTTPYTGRSPSPSPLTPNSATSKGNSNNGADRRHDLFVAMNDRLTVGGRSPSPSPLQQQFQSHLSSSPSSSPTLRPTGSTTPSAGSATGTVSRRKKKQKVVRCWKWTGKNDYMVLSDPGFIGFGGGDGKFGLWIHSDLEIGHSSRCATFDNEPLPAACHHPIHKYQQHQSATPNTIPTSDALPHSRSSSPKGDEEEFYCQTVEIWSMSL